MAEALGLASAIISIVTVASQVTSLTYNYISDIRNATKSQKAYLVEVLALRDVLIQAEKAFYDAEINGSSEEQRPTLSKVMIGECLEVLENLKIKLQNHQEDHKTAKSGRARLMWPFEEKQTKKQIEMFHRYRDIFAQAMLQKMLMLTTATHENTDHLIREQDRLAILDWLSDSSNAGSFSKPKLTTDSACPETGQWLLNCEEYLDWMTKSPSILWCYGKPGVGKTVMSGIVLQNLLQESNSTTVLHHFCDFADRNIQTTAAVLKDLLRQIARHGSKAQVSALVEFCKDDNQAHGIRPLCQAFFLSCSKQKTVLVIDGLDEFEDRKSIYPIFQKATESGCSILVTSRVIPDIQNMFSKERQVEIVGRREDLEVYIHAQFKDSEFGSISEDSDIVSAIVDRASNIFLLAQLLMMHITSLTTIKQIRSYLKTSPSSLPEAYKSSHNRILAQSPNRAALAQRLISWITNSETRLTVDQIIHAFAVDEGDEEIDEENLISKNTLLQVCVGLVVINPGDLTVSMVHITAYEYFRGNGKGYAMIHEDIVNTCIRYLCLRPLSYGPCASYTDLRVRFQNLPFLEYASRHWGKHAREMESTVSPLIAKVIEIPSLRASSIQALHYCEQQQEELAEAMFETLPVGQGPLHVIAYWGLTEIAMNFLTNAIELSPLDSQKWTPLHWSCFNGHEAITKLLISHGADVNIMDSQGWTPLFWASFKDYPDLVDLLLSNKAHHFYRDVHGWNALQWAVSAGAKKTVEILLQQDHRDPGAGSGGGAGDIEVKTLTVEEAEKVQRLRMRYKLPIEIAADAGDFDMFGTLLKDIYSDDGKASHKRFNMLWPGKELIIPMSTIWRSWTKIDRLNNSYLTSGGENWKSRLLIASFMADQFLVFLLLIQMGADVDFQVEKSKRSLLHLAAVDNKYLRYVEALLQNNADITLQDRNGRTALHYSIIEGCEEIIIALLEAGSDVNGQESRGETPLMMVYQEAVPKDLDLTLVRRIISKLLERGADISIRNSHGLTALHCVMKFCDANIIEDLLIAGADFTAKDDDDKTCLHYFAESARETITGEAQRCLDLLLKHSEAEAINKTCRVLYNFRDVGDGNPASVALMAYNWKIFVLLIEKGASLPSGIPIELLERTLERAAKTSNEPIIEPLINYGIRFRSGSTGYMEIIKAAQKLSLEQISNSAERTELLPLFSTFLKRCIGAGIDTNFTIQVAEGLNSSAIMQIFLDVGFDLYQARADKFDVFLAAAVHENTETLDCLLFNASIKPRKDHWLQLSDYPVVNFSTGFDCICAALKRCGALDILYDGGTMLHLAVSHNSSKFLSTLLSYGADIEATNTYGWRPLHSAVFYGYEDIVNILLDANAAVRVHTEYWVLDQSKPRDLKSWNYEIWEGQPLHIAAVLGRPIIVELLLAKGADIEASAEMDNQYKGETALHYALGNLSTALHFALKNPHTGFYLTPSNQNSLAVARILIEKGANMQNIADKFELNDILYFKNGFEDLWNKLRKEI